MRPCLSKVMPNPKAKLLDQVREVLRVKHYSIHTEDAYVGWIKRFIFFHGKRHPREMGAAEVQTFLSDLAVRGEVSASTQNQALKRVPTVRADADTFGVNTFGVRESNVVFSPSSARFLAGPGRVKRTRGSVTASHFSCVSQSTFGVSP
jgi:integrase-like protein